MQKVKRQASGTFVSQKRPRLTVGPQYVDLPLCLVHVIMDYLQPRDLCSLMQTNRHYFVEGVEVLIRRNLERINLMEGLRTSFGTVPEIHTNTPLQKLCPKYTKILVLRLLRKTLKIC